MSEVRKWLDTIGLAQYADAFETNDLDIDLLGQVDDQLLKDIGVSSAGHRLRIRNAIAKLSQQEKRVSNLGAATDAASATAERRQVTVMFSDLVGSTALSARMDPEDLREVISAYQKCVADIVQRFGGFVAKYMGDGVLIYFGYPQAHEDDAERAVRAGLELVAAVGALKTHARLQTRVGIATGLVVVGDLIGSGEAQERGIVGETPNLAARLQGIAEPNSVVIAESTRKLVGNLFEVADLGAKDLKGIVGPVRAWAALRQATVESRFDALHTAGLTELVGREEELEILLRRWSKAKTGEGQVVLLSGEPGIGKSRLIAALLERLITEPHTRIRSFCSPQHTDSAFYPIIGQMERAAGLTLDDTLTAKLDKLDAMLARSSTSAQDAALVAELLSLSNDGRFPALELTPQQRRQRTLEVLVSQIVALSHQSPVLMIFEDAHWADPTSLELFGRIVDKIPTLRVLLIVTFRPDFEPPWIGWHHVTALTLNRLGEREIGTLIDHVTGNSALPESIRQDIIERTDGIPLFVEEMTKAVLEAENEDEAGKTAAAVPSAALAVPSSLHASLMARLDRLGPAKELAQIGAVIGRAFPYALIAAVAHKAETELRSALDRLVLAGLLFRQGLPPQATYLFKHALVQDAAYGTLLREQRRALHARIAATLESQFAEIAENQPELLARHCTEAGWIEKAVAYWGLAGRQSLARSAMIESIAQARKGLDLLAHLPKEPESWRQELDLQKVLGAALLASRGNAAPETGQAYTRAHELCEQLGDTAALIPVLGALSTYHQTAGEYAAMRRISKDLLRIGDQQNNTVGSLVGNRSMGLCLYHVGEFVAARSCLERVLDLYTPAAHDALVTVTSFDVRTGALSYLSMILVIEGQPEQAAPFSQQALTVSKALRNPHNRVFCLNYAAVSKLLMRDEPAAEELLDDLLVLATEHRFPVWQGTANIMRGYVLVGRGETRAGLALAQKGWADFTTTGSKYHGTYYLGLLAQACERADQPDEAQDLVDGALEAADKIGERWFEAELRRVQGEWLVAHRQKEGKRAEACFHHAIDLARSQNAKMFELRASMSLARLWRSQGKSQQARELLAPVYGWFTEGFDTRDLKEAKALLDGLAST